MAHTTQTQQDRLLSVLCRHVGRENGVAMTQLCTEYRQRWSEPLSERLGRHLVEDLREAGAHICGRPETGYFLARDPDELDDTCQFLYARAMSSLRKIAAMRRVAVPDLRGQLRMPHEPQP